MDSRKLHLMIFVLTTIGVCLFIQETTACSCMPAHPQTEYCRSDFVIVARILRRSNRKINNKHVYKIDIVKTYKMDEKAQQYLKPGRILTAPDDAMCGFSFKIGQLYALIGNSQHIGLCNYVREYSRLTIVEKRGIAGAYRKGCGCQIQHCYNNLNCGGCDWAPWNTCENDFGICVPSKSFPVVNGKATKCHWRRSPSYLDCIQSP